MADVLKCKSVCVCLCLSTFVHLTTILHTYVLGWAKLGLNTLIHNFTNLLNIPFACTHIYNQHINTE